MFHDMMSGLAKNAKRVGTDMFVAGAILALFVIYGSGGLAWLGNPVQLLLYKALLVSAAVIHAHITRKLMFPRVAWLEPSWTPHKVLIIVFYASFIIGYTRGG